MPDPFLGISDTSAAAALTSAGWPSPRWSVRKFHVPQLFAKVQKAHGEFEQGGYITHDEAQRQVNKSVEECS